MGAVKILQKLYLEPGRLQFIYADLGDAAAVFSTLTFYHILYSLSFPFRLIRSLPSEIWFEKFFLSFLLNQVNEVFSENAFDAVMHFAAVAYVGESTVEPLRFLPLLDPIPFHLKSQE